MIGNEPEAVVLRQAHVCQEKIGIQFPFYDAECHFGGDGLAHIVAFGTKDFGCELSDKRLVFNQKDRGRAV